MKLRFWRLPLRFDASPLQAEVQTLHADHWPTHFNTGYHDGGWSGVSLISPDGDSQRLYSGGIVSAVSKATPLLAECPALRAALEAIPATIETARLLRLGPGSVIREHRDDCIGLDEGLVRLHIPIVSHPEVEFYVDGERVPMAEGECWYLDFGLPHRVSNPGPHERVHLVIDCLVGARLLALLPDAEAGERQLAKIQAGAPETSTQRFERFRSRVLSDPALQDRLFEIEDPASFVDTVTRLGAEGRHGFGIEDVRAAMQAGRRAWFERHLL
jgi:hypothetical protein